MIIDFTEHPESQEVRLNESVTLQCAVSNGEVTHWLFNNGPLPSEGVTANGGMLVISSFQLQLAGNYRCVARSTNGTFSQVSHYARISHFSKFHGLSNHSKLCTPVTIHWSSSWILFSDWLAGWFMLTGFCKNTTNFFVWHSSSVRMVRIGVWDMKADNAVWVWVW